MRSSSKVEKKIKKFHVVIVFNTAIYTNKGVHKQECRK